MFGAGEKSAALTRVQSLMCGRDSDPSLADPACEKKLEQMYNANTTDLTEQLLRNFDFLISGIPRHPYFTCVTVPKRDPSAKSESEEFKKKAIACTKKFVDGEQEISYYNGPQEYILKISALFAKIREIAGKKQMR